MRKEKNKETFRIKEGIVVWIVKRSNVERYSLINDNEESKNNHSQSY